MRLAISSFVTLMIFTGSAFAAGPSQDSPYAGQEAREIKSLSAQDIDDLRNGRGWGLAKAAELNGMPGPAHLLELRKEIGLSSQQIEQIEALFHAMKAKATKLGIRLIGLERGLNESFSKRTVTQASLESQLAEIVSVRKALRLTHLETHLRTPKVLTGHQIAAYNRLRGYDASGSCGTGHGGHGASDGQHMAANC